MSILYHSHELNSSTTYLTNKHILANIECYFQAKAASSFCVRSWPAAWIQPVRLSYESACPEVTVCGQPI